MEEWERERGGREGEGDGGMGEGVEERREEGWRVQIQRKKRREREEKGREGGEEGEAYNENLHEKRLR